MSRIVVTQSPLIAMQAIADAARYHPMWVGAEPLQTRVLLRVMAKLRDRYPDLERDRHHALRLRRAGRASHYLVILRPRRGHSGGFWLLTSAPDDAERWQDLRERDGRLTLRWWELVRHTRRGQASPAWTWRMRPDVRAEKLRQLDEAIAKRWDGWIADFCRSSMHWPGFAGIRGDHKLIMQHIRARWLRVRRDPCPELPFLPYVRRRSRT
jgi:hypothetical protein